MLDFKVIRTNNGESFLGIIKEETSESITVWNAVFIAAT